MYEYIKDAAVFSNSLMLHAACWLMFVMSNMIETLQMGE
jgi:hypothetical protein